MLQPMSGKAAQHFFNGFFPSHLLYNVAVNTAQVQLSYV